jgi:type I restriction enzyme S subunit
MREDWIEVELGELSLLELGGDWGKDPNIEDNEYLEAYCIRGSEFRNWENDKGKTASLRKIKKDSIEKRNLFLDDILVEISGGGPEQPVGRTVVIEHSVLNHFKDKNLVCTNFLRLIRPSVFVNSIYLNHYLKYFYSTGKIIPYQSGSNNLRNLKFNDYLTIEIPFSPLPIQRAIVSKIEALFSDLDNGIANFKKAQEQLKIYRQAVLKKAFEGELTKEWREKQTHLPTAEELLKQIKEERQNHYNQQMEDWKKAVKDWEKNGKKGKKPNKPRKLKELSSFTEDELNEFVELPKNWIWSKVDKIIDHNTHSIKAGPFGSSLKKSFYVEKGYKIYGQEQVISGNHKFGNYYVNEEKYQELFSCAVKPKDALISLVGTVGKVLILPDDSEQGIINPRLIKISFNSFYSPIFFKYYFESAYLKSLYAHKSHGATMDIITLGIIQELPFPLFSIREQTQIVQEIESRLSVCDKMEQSITESIEKAEALRQSILKKAFEGKLLSQAEIELCKQAADYEPASELLKKIQAEKLAKEQEKKKPTVKMKSKK